MSNPFENYKILTILLSTVVSVFIGFLIVFAGNLNPTSAPGTTMYTLEQIYCKMTGCTPVTPHSLDSPGSPTTGTMYTLEQVYNAAPAFRTNPGNVTQDDICNSKQAYADTNTMITGRRSTNYNGTGASYCCACRVGGQACNHNDQCCSGYCSRDGYCCSTACTDACKTCSTGTCANTPNTNWGAGLYGCTGSTNRCYDGVCRTCGGWFYTGANGNYYCWYSAGYNVLCSTFCSNKGGYIPGIKDVAGCPICRHWMGAGTTCSSYASSIAPCYQSSGAYACFYQNNTTDWTDYNIIRFCPCNY